MRHRTRPAAASAVRVVPPLAAAVLLVAAWELVSLHDRFVLPHPWAVVTQLSAAPGSWVADTGTTVEEAFLGLLLGFGFGLGLAVVTVLVPLLRRALLPLAVLANVTPIVAIAPALVVAFGFGPTPKVIVTAVMCLFPSFVNAGAGLARPDPELVEVLAVLHAGPTEVLRRVRLPASLPYVFVALRICVPLSVVGAVVAELVSPGSSSGLGTVIALSAPNAQLARVYAAVVCLAVVGVASSAVVLLAERRVLSRWGTGRGG